MFMGKSDSFLHIFMGKVLCFGTKSKGFSTDIYCICSENNSNLQYLKTDCNSVSQGNDRSYQGWIMFQFIQILTHSLIYGSVSALYQIMGFYDISLLKHIVRDENTAIFHKTHHIRKPVDILSLCSIHKNHVKRIFQFF